LLIDGRRTFLQHRRKSSIDDVGLEDAIVAMAFPPLSGFRNAGAT
jgi:hypothetical protein